MDSDKGNSKKWIFKFLNIFLYIICFSCCATNFRRSWRRRRCPWPLPAGGPDFSAPTGPLSFALTTNRRRSAPRGVGTCPSTPRSPPRPVTAWAFPCCAQSPRQNGGRKWIAWIFWGFWPKNRVEKFKFFIIFVSGSPNRVCSAGSFGNCLLAAT